MSWKTWMKKRLLEITSKKKITIYFVIRKRRYGISLCSREILIEIKRKLKYLGVGLNTVFREKHM